MKKKSLVLLIIPMLLMASCQDGSSNVPASSDSLAADFQMSDFSIDVTADYSYSIGFSLNRDLRAGDKIYFSSDSRYDSGDKEASNIGSLNRVRLSYTDTENDFYILLVDSQNSLLAKENLVIPTFNMSIVSGTSDNAGNDIITFSYLDNSYTPKNFFDTGGITIYRGSKEDFDKTTAEKVIDNATISDEFIIPEAVGRSYYLLTSYFGGGKGIYTSKVFTKDSDFSQETFAISSLDISDADGINLQIDGSIKKSTISKAYIMIVNSEDPITYTSALAINPDRTFSGSFDLSELNKPSTAYQVYMAFSCGVFAPISYQAIGNTLPDKKIYADKVFSFYDNSGQLSLIFKNKAVVNILKAMFEIEDDKVYFSASGIFDSNLFPTDPSTDKTMELADPSLIFISDSKTEPESVAYPITVSENNFSVRADLSLITKLGPWYSIKLFFNTSVSANSLGGTEFINDPTYELRLSDANNFSQTAKSQINTDLYRFQNYEGYLKLEVRDYSASIDSWKYIMVNGRMQLRLKGSFYRGESHFSIYADGKTDIHEADVITNDDYSFQTDIDINDIKSDTIYHVHWIGKDFGDLEITNELLAKPTSVNSSEDGYIFCVKQEYYQSTRYFKVYKDKDWAKATQMTFLSQSNKPYINVSGYLNSALDTSNLFIQLQALSFDGEAESYLGEKIIGEVKANIDHSFSCSLDLETMVKGLKYQMKIVKKNGDIYEDISLDTISYSGFYTEYLPSDFGLKSLVTASGTYRIRNFGGENNHWEIYLTLI